MTAQVVAILGAESTGKTTLSQQLAMTLSQLGYAVLVVEEYLREFCEREGRTPQRNEQLLIASEQTRRIEAAAQTAELVIADTTALMTAVYSDWIYQDLTLYPTAILAHCTYALTLVTATDLPWVADGLQRDGPQVCEPISRLVNQVLSRHRIAYYTVSGVGPRRIQSASNIVKTNLGLTQREAR
jgi:nicotinamide riboside kinase